MKRNDLSIYVHYPFCKSKCPYCDFNSHVKNGVDQDRFLQAYLSELEYFASQLKGRKIKSIFFGGGTPSLMEARIVEGILDKITTLWQVDENCEISLEANPTSFEAEKFKDFKLAGINRLSIGIQAMNDADLKFLGRQHSASEAIKTIRKAAQIFDNYSFDLIYARPEQSLSNWQKELKEAIKLAPHHLSLYQLTIEKGTKFYGQHKAGDFHLPDSDLAADFYDTTNQITSNAGLELYEISNYSQTGLECQHNLVYWQGGDYLGIGAGAHGRLYLDKENYRYATMMIHGPMSWLKKVEENGAGIQKIDKITESELLEELILMGLRLKEGMSNNIFLTYFSKNISDIFDFNQLQLLVDQGFLELNENVIKISNKGRILSNLIINKVCDAIKNNT